MIEKYPLQAIKSGKDYARLISPDMEDWAWANEFKNVGLLSALSYQIEVPYGCIAIARVPSREKIGSIYLPDDIASTEKASSGIVIAVGEGVPKSKLGAMVAARPYTGMRVLGMKCPEIPPVPEFGINTSKTLVKEVSGKPIDTFLELPEDTYTNPLGVVLNKKYKGWYAVLSTIEPATQTPMMRGLGYEKIDGISFIDDPHIFGYARPGTSLDHAQFSAPGFHYSVMSPVTYLEDGGITPNGRHVLLDRETGDKTESGLLIAAHQSKLHRQNATVLAVGEDCIDVSPGYKVLLSPQAELLKCSLGEIAHESDILAVIE